MNNMSQVKVRPGQDTDRPTPYRMILDETSDLDMPDSVGESLEVYRATLGHKVSGGGYTQVKCTDNSLQCALGSLQCALQHTPGVPQFPA